MYTPKPYFLKHTQPRQRRQRASIANVCVASLVVVVVGNYVPCTVRTRHIMYISVTHELVRWNPPRVAGYAGCATPVASLCPLGLQEDARPHDGGTEIISRSHHRTWR